MRRRPLSLLILTTMALVTLGTTPPAQALSLSFTMPSQELDIWVNADGTARLRYLITFSCDSGSDPIDIVDIGLPTSDFDRQGIQASVLGRPPIDSIGSDYQGTGSGVAVHLGAATIQPGQTGTLMVVVPRVGRMLYEDTTDPDYASIQFAPTYFGREYVHGSTAMTVTLYLPEGIQYQEPRWHASPSGWPQEPVPVTIEGRNGYRWINRHASPSTLYVFGASFPRKYVDASSIQKTPPGIQTTGQEPSFTGVLDGVRSVVCSVPMVVLGFIVLVTLMGARLQSKRRMEYVPPTMKVEGVGIKRGLTAVEAAVVLERPLNNILTMTLFGLLKKRALTVLSDHPLTIQTSEKVPEQLHPYEMDFLAAVKKDGTLDESLLRTMMVKLIQEVNNKMKGFSWKETVAYYRDIVQRAWQQVEGAATPEVRGQLFGEGLEWTMLDDDFSERTERTFRDGPVFLPTWWEGYRPWGPAVSGGPAASGPVSIPAADFAAKVVRGASDTAGRIVRSLTGFTGSVTQTTNPPPVSSSSRTGGGSGCACACACACAGCACACAGGGR